MENEMIELGDAIIEAIDSCAACTAFGPQHCKSHKVYGWVGAGTGREAALAAIWERFDADIAAGMDPDCNTAVGDRIISEAYERRDLALYALNGETE